MSRRAKWLRGIALSWMLAVLALGALTARAVSDGEAQMTKSDRAFNQGDLGAALEHARRAAVAYAPGAPHVAAAYARLMAIAVGAEAQGNRALTLRAWRDVRGAALETRHVWTPHRHELERANRNLARLEAAPPAPPDARQITGPIAPSAAASAGAPEAGTDTVLRSAASKRAERAAERRILRELRRDDAPDAFWVLALGVGLFAAAAGLGLLAWRGVSPDGRWVVFHARLGLLLAVLGAACWTIAVWRA